MGSGSAVSLGIREQAVPFLWDQGPKLFPLLESKKFAAMKPIKLPSVSLAKCFFQTQ